MSDGRRTVAGLALVAATAMTVAGCTATGPAGSPAPAPAPAASARAGTAADPAAAAALAAAAAQLGTTSFAISITSGSAVSLTGRMDAPNSTGASTLKLAGNGAALTVETVLLGRDLYVQVPGVTTAGTWMHLDVSRLPEGANVGLRPGQVDPADTQRLLTSTTDVRQVDARSYAGTVDLTKVAGLTGVDDVTVDSWGAAASKVPFRAGLDARGRLSALTLDLPAVGGQNAQPLEVLYTDYGAPVVVQKPAQVTEAPAELYKTLGGS